jgi:hypothetical protein
MTGKVTTSYTKDCLTSVFMIHMLDHCSELAVDRIASHARVLFKSYDQIRHRENRPLFVQVSQASCCSENVPGLKPQMQDLLSTRITLQNIE